jgi:hypothetical protein
MFCLLLLSSVLLVVHAHIPRQDTPSPTPTGSSSLPSPSPLLFFSSVRDLTACTSGTISWIYAGPDAPMTLAITNDGVSQQDPSSSSSTTSTPSTAAITARAVPIAARAPPQTNITLATNISPLNSSSFTWPQVILQQGNYIATAHIPSLQFTSTSLPFFVSESSDTSCLSVTSTSSTTSLSSADPTISAIASSSSSSSVNKGAIVGGVVGGAVFLIAVLILYLFIRRKRPSSHNAPYSGSSPSTFITSRKGWGGLSSVDNNHSFFAASSAPTRKLSKRFRNNGTHTAGTTARHPDSLPNQEEAVNNSYRSANGFRTSEEKFSSTEEVMAMATLPSNDGRRQSSISDSLYNEAAAGTKRRPSLKSTSSISPGARRPSLDSTSPPAAYNSHSSHSHSSQNVAAAHDTEPTTCCLKDLPKKRTPRKPVPVYVPSSSPPPPPNVSYPAPTQPSPFITDAEITAQRPPSGHYGVSSKGEQQLNHKSSFGPGGVEGKPLHYLIPDMPSSGP